MQHKVTRIGVFETNSSSCHSLVIHSGGELNQRLPMTAGVCTIYPGEFGWGPERFTDAPTKASYLYVYAQDKPDKLEMLRRAIQNQMNAQDVVFVRTESDEWPVGYIDHQSADRAEKAFELEDSLKRFIFDPKSELIIDNDNH